MTSFNRRQYLTFRIDDPVASGFNLDFPSKQIVIYPSGYVYVTFDSDVLPTGATRIGLIDHPVVLNVETQYMSFEKTIPTEVEVVAMILGEIGIGTAGTSFAADAV